MPYPVCQSIKSNSSLFPDLLAQENRKMDSLVAVTLLVPKMENFARINQVYISYFASNPPIRVCVENSEKALRLTAVGNDKNAKETMHVQSISHWAPANIGPYSQATKVRKEKSKRLLFALFFLWSCEDSPFFPILDFW